MFLTISGTEAGGRSGAELSLRGPGSKPGFNTNGEPFLESPRLSQALSLPLLTEYETDLSAWL